MCVPLATVNWAAFSVAWFSGLSDDQECLGGLQMALVYVPGRATKSPHNWVVRLAIDLAFRDICTSIETI